MKYSTLGNISALCLAGSGILLLSLFIMIFKDHSDFVMPVGLLIFSLIVSYTIMVNSPYEYMPKTMYVTFIAIMIVNTALLSFCSSPESIREIFFDSGIAISIHNIDVESIFKMVLFFIASGASYTVFSVLEHNRKTSICHFIFTERKGIIAKAKWLCENKNRWAGVTDSNYKIQDLQRIIDALDCKSNKNFKTLIRNQLWLHVLILSEYEIEAMWLSSADELNYSV